MPAFRMVNMRNMEETASLLQKYTIKITKLKKRMSWASTKTKQQEQQERPQTQHHRQQWQ